MSKFGAVDWTAMSRSAQDLERLSTQYAGIMALAKTVGKIASIEAIARATESDESAVVPQGNGPWGGRC